MNEIMGNKRYLLLLTSTAALGGLLFGFDIAIITGAAPFIKDHFNLKDIPFGWMVSSLLWGCILGAAVSGRITDRFGRKKILLFIALLFILTSASCGLAPDINLLILSRFTGGIAVGSASVLSPMYISEISPARDRGKLVSLYQLSIVIGILVSYLINYVLHDTGPDNWRWMFLTGVLPSLLFGTLLLFIPETPRYLCILKKYQEAHHVLSRINGEKNAQKELDEIIKSLKEGTKGFFLLLQPQYRRMMLVGFGLAVFVQVSGINTIIDYAPIILKTAGWKIDAALFSTFIIGIVNFVFTLVSIWAIDTFGRRPLYLAGSAGMTILLISITLAQMTGHFTGTFSLLLILAYIAFFASCIGPVFWTLVSEIFPNHIRGLAMSVPVFTQWIANAVVVMFFPWMLNQAGGVITFGVLALMSMLMFLFTLRYVPETRGKTLEEIETQWKK